MIIKEVKKGDLGLELEKDIKAYTNGFNSGLDNLGKRIVRYIRRNMTLGPQTGFLYEGVRASSANEYPAVRTGRLHQSISSKNRGGTLHIESDIPYSGFVEEGTRFMDRDWETD